MTAYQIQADAVAEAQYAGPNLRLAMTLKHLKWIAIATPIVVVIAQEIVRTAIVGRVSLPQRLILDAVAVAGILLFSLFIFRFVDKMQERLRRQNEELLALHSAGLDVAAELSLDAVLKKVVDQARKLVGAKYGALSVIDDKSRIEAFLTSGISAEERAAIGPPPVGHGLLGVVLHHGYRLRMDDLTKDPRSHGFPPNHPPMHSLLAVPVVCKSPFRGNLYLTEKEDPSGHFTQDDEETLERFAVQAAIAIDNAYLHQQAADLAIAQERVRIAHEMHDGLAQILGYVNTKAQAVDAYLKRGKVEDASVQLRELASSARQAYGDVRESIIDLRSLPGPERSLTEVLEQYLERWKEQSGVSTQLTIAGDVRFRPGVELQVVRIVQESLTNIRKHARAATARVDIRRKEGRVFVTIADDGVGFDPAQRSRGDFPQFGLSTMRERAESIGATLNVDSAPGRGTTVRFELPLDAT